MFTGFVMVCCAGGATDFPLRGRISPASQAHVSADEEDDVVF
jgi:hypothetical protein